MSTTSDGYNITVGFSTTNKFTSAFIRWLTRSSCSHSFIAFNDSALGMRMVMQAEAWGFEIRPWKRWNRENILVAEFRPKSGPLEASLRNISKRLGTKYNYRSAIVIGIKSLLSLWYKNRFTLNINHSPWKLTCSEAVVRFLKKGNYKTVAELNPETTSPGRLLREIILHPEEFKKLDINARYVLFDKIIKQSPKLYKMGKKARKKNFKS
ncbi:MAG: hypothetical protein JW807_10750 [Spirochaetes bacterium]|nr:hypothetical protein [Spirochaetota bacterium]